MNFKEVKYKEFHDFTETLDEYTTSIYCEGANNESAGGIAYLVNGQQVATTTIVGKQQQYYILERK